MAIFYNEGNTMSKQDAASLLKKVRDLDKVEDDSRIEHKERTALDFTSSANWDLLEAMRCGVHHKREFDCLGVPISLRLITAGEQKKILTDLLHEGLIPMTTGIYEMEYTTRILEISSTKHPAMKDEPTLSKATLDNMPQFLIDELGQEYLHYISTVNAPLGELSDNEIKEYIAMLEKKPQLLKDLRYTQTEQIMIYLIEQYQTLMQQVRNLTMQS